MSLILRRRVYLVIGKEHVVGNHDCSGRSIERTASNAGMQRSFQRSMRTKSTTASSSPTVTVASPSTIAQQHVLALAHVGRVIEAADRACFVIDASGIVPQDRFRSGYIGCSAFHAKKIKPELTKAVRPCTPALRIRMPAQKPP